MPKYSSYSARLDVTLSQLGVLAAAIMLSVDTLNPIKLVCDVLGVPSYFAAYPFAVLLVYLFIGELNDLLFYSIKIFFTSILSIFFAKIDVIGHSNIPLHGPVIFTGNHANQFVDALQVMTNCGHKVGFLIARKSFNHPVVGTFARGVGCLPVMRPQDAAIKMPKNETIIAKGTKVTGTNTHFTKALEVRDKIRFRGKPDQLKVKEVLNDTELVLMEDCPAELEALGEWNWDVLKYIDQHTVFADVHRALAQGRCLGIFPEGGSHDRTDLLPLKVGIAVIAFGTLEKYNISVPVVPIGLSYFRGHRFRGRAVVEFGAPIRISPEQFQLYKTDKRAAYSQFLHNIEDSMRACIVTAPDYTALRLVYTARRLFQDGHRMPTPAEKQDMNRRFAEGYKLLMEKYAADAGSDSGTDESKSHWPNEALGLFKHLEEYRSKLSQLGLRDYQVPTLTDISPLKVTYTLVHLCLVMLLSSVPSLILNAPVGLMGRMAAAAERKKALAGSVVKITARDVMMSKKIIISIVMVPLLWLTYALLLFLFTSWNTSTKVLVVLCMPIFSYCGVMATEAGMVDVKDLKPLIMRLRPKMRREMMQLPQQRAALQKELREFIESEGSRGNLGELYENRGLIDWGARMNESKSSANLEALLADSAKILSQG
ncbi:unnamed protein product [Chrysoparadoxa australica]